MTKQELLEVLKARRNPTPAMYEAAYRYPQAAAAWFTMFDTMLKEIEAPSSDEAYIEKLERFVRAADAYDAKYTLETEQEYRFARLATGLSRKS